MEKYIGGKFENMSQVDHIAIAVRSIEHAREIFEALGGRAGLPEAVPDQGVLTLPIDFKTTRIELLEPLTPESPVGRFISRRGEGLHHIALQVSDISTSLAHAAKAGITALDLLPRKGAGGRLIAFLNPKTTGGVLVELTQREDQSDAEEKISNL